jgi:DNA-binding MarR family transcriptional regulator
MNRTPPPNAPVSEFVIQHACPHCGHRYADHIPQQDALLLNALRRLARHSPTVSSQALALEVHLSRSQTVRRLGALERMGRVRRVGQRGGWRLAV